VSRRRDQAFRLHGTWPGDRDPAVEAAQDAVARRDLERARRLLSTPLEFRPLTPGDRDCSAPSRGAFPSS
jgi:hypothetical protein